jgi:hypothetical protein
MNWSHLARIIDAEKDSGFKATMRLLEEDRLPHQPGNAPPCARNASRRAVAANALRQPTACAHQAKKPSTGRLTSIPARLCLATNHLPLSRLSAPPRDPAWLAGKPSLWPSILPILHQTVLRAAPETRRRLAVVPPLANGGTTASLRGVSGGAMEI